MQASKPQFCRTCESLDVLQFEEHIMTKLHQISAHKEKLTAFRATHGIYVHNLPPNITKFEIVSFFAQYGSIISCMVNDKNAYGLFEYADKGVAADLLKSKKVDFNGRSIFIKPRNPKPEKKYVNEDPPKQIAVEVIQLLRTQDDIRKEIDILHFYLQPARRDAYYATLCMDLKNVLAHHMHCIVYPFGSTITGLDFEKSDVDAYVYVDPKDRICGSVTGDALAKRLVQIIPQILTASQLFVRVVSIPNANTPIVKCVHVRTGISCDINFKNMLGVCNSYLIKKYLSYNQNLKIAIVILKYWAQVHNLTSVGKFSNYTISILFLYCFMQQPYNLPSIFQVQRNHVCNMQNGWDAGFEFGDYQISTELNKLTLVEMLREFFKFYSTFNYSDLVICPYIGRAIERSCFVEGGSLPAEYNLYKDKLSSDGLYPTTPICVQDCFELCRNITRPVTVQDFEEFVDVCNEATIVLHSTTSLHLYPIFFDSSYSDEDIFHFILVETNKLKPYLKATNNQLFQNFVKDLMTKLFAEVYFFHVQVEIPATSMKLSSSPPVKAQKMDNQNDIHDFHVIFDCESYINLWSSRAIIAKDQTRIKNENVLDAEIRLSNYIADTVCDKIKTKRPLMKLQIALNKSPENAKDVQVILTNKGTNQQKAAFKEFRVVFVKYVRNFLAKYIKHLIEPPQIEDVEANKE